MAGRKKTETVEAEVVETAVVPAGKMEFRLINPTEDGFLRRIQWNKEELEAAVRAKIAGYENVVYTEENIKAAKNDRAELNKLIKAIEERRKQVKNIINEPYTVFEAELKEITALINEPVALIDQQAKAIAEPLSTIDKVTIIDGNGEGSGVGSMGSYVPQVLAKTMESVKEVTGIDIADIMRANTYDAKVNKNVNITGLDGIKVEAPAEAGTSVDTTVE